MELLVGKVGRAHGVRGDVTIDVRTDEPDRRFATGTVFSTARGTLTVASMRWHSGRLLLRFDGVADRSAAEALRGTELRAEIDPTERPDDPEEFYDHQLVGLWVETEDDGAPVAVGELVEVLHLPAQDLLVVRRTDGGPDALVPFVSEFVPTVDLTTGRLVITDRIGLLTTEDDSEDAAAVDETATGSVPGNPGV